MEAETIRLIDPNIHEFPNQFSSPSNTTILFVRVRPINRARFVLLGPSQRTSTLLPIRRSRIRRFDSFTTWSKS